MSLSNPLHILELVRGVDWPADRAELLRVAERNDADEVARLALAELPDRRFESAQDLRGVLDDRLPASAAGSGPRGTSSEGDDLGEHPSKLNPPRA